MSNLIYSGELYNRMQKERFLDSVGIGEDTRKTYNRIFIRSASLEEALDQDLCQFNLPQIEQFLTLLDPLSIAASVTNGWIVQNYIRWAIVQGLRNNSINPLDAFSGKEYYGKFVDKSKKRIFTKDEIDDTIHQLLNAQDAVIIQLLFEGVEVYELLNLTRADVDFDQKIIKLRDKKGAERYFYNLSPKGFELIKRAFSEKSYFKNNGVVSEDIKSREIPLIATDYLLKKSASNVLKERAQGDYHLVSRRMNTIRNAVHFPYMTIKTIRNSGMLWELKQMYDVKKTLQADDYRMICEKFHISLNKDQSDYNYMQLKADFLNIESIKEVYSDS